MPILPKKYYYKLLENSLVLSNGQVVTSNESTPQITLGQKSYINIQLVNSDMTSYTGLESGTSANLMIDSDYANDAIPVPLGNTYWTNTSGFEYAEYLEYEPTYVYFNGVLATLGSGAGSLSSGQYYYDSTAKYIYVRLSDDSDPTTQADNYITAEFDISNATPPFIECYGDVFNLANSWYDTTTEVFRNPDITSGEITFLLDANTVNFYQRIGTTSTINSTAQMQFFVSSVNIDTRNFSFLCKNRIFGSGESAAVLRLNGIGYYTKTEADSRFVRQDLTTAYTESLTIPDDAAFFVENGTVGSSFITGLTLKSGAAGEVNTASNLGAGAGIYAQKVGVDIQFKSLVAGGNITITPGSNDITISSTGGGASLSVTDGTSTETDVDAITFSGATVATSGTGAVTVTVGADMTKAMYDPTGVEADAFDSANHAYDNSTSGTTATNVQGVIDESIELINGLTKNRVLTQTGWIDPPILSVNGGDNTKFDISAGVGIIADWSDPTNPTFTQVNFAGATAQTVTYLATEYASGILISSAGAIVQNAGVTIAQQYRQYLLVGDLLHSSLSYLDGVQNKPLLQWDSIGSIRDLSLAVGVINTSGNVYSANGTNLQIKKTSGQYYRAGVNYATNPENPNYVTNASAAPVTNMLYGYRDGTGGWIYSPATVIAPNSYDDGDGTLGTVGNNNYTIQRILNFPNSNQTIVLYGQKIYTSLSNAITGLRDSFEIDANLRDAALRATLIVVGQATNLSDTATAVFYSADKFGSVSGGAAGGTVSSDHNDLNGLQGGAAGEYYHFDYSAYTAITDNTSGTSADGYHHHSITGVDGLSTALSGKASAGANSDITSLSGLTTALSISQGGTGATSGTTALTSLGAVGSASNLGSGSGVFYQKSGTDLQFKGLVAGSNITLTPSADSITIAATSGGTSDYTINTISTASATLAKGQVNIITYASAGTYTMPTLSDGEWVIIYPTTIGHTINYDTVRSFVLNDGTTVTTYTIEYGQVTPIKHIAYATSYVSGGAI